MNPKPIFSSTGLRTLGIAGMLVAWAPFAGAQTAIPAALRVTSGVDTTKPGVLIRTYQVDEYDTQGQLNAMERLIAGELGPNTANLSDPSYTYDAGRKYFTLDGNVGLNFRHDAGDGADNGQFVGPDYPDRSIPGLPGTVGSADQAASEAIAFLEFKAAGLYEMGVSSDDCFKLSTWYNPRDRFALRLGSFDGTRGMAESRVILLNIPEPGIYPFRCLWGNATGATGWEWYLFDTAGNRNLINDTTNGVATAYREGPLRPYVVSVFPDIGAANISVSSPIIVELEDEGLAVDGASIQVVLNNGATTGIQTVSKSGTRTTVLFTPAEPLLAGSTNQVRLIYADNGASPISVTDEWSFVTSDIVLAPAAAVPADQVDKTSLGFRLFVHQLDGVEFDNGAMLVNIRDQLEGLLGANTADLSQADASGYFYFSNPLAGGTDVINLNNGYNVQPPETGNFTSANGFPDIEWPGTPGSGGLDWNRDNLATEILAYVEFPTAGGYTIGVKSWDSFSVTVGDAEGRSPKDLFATVLGDFDGDAPGNYLFSFSVPQPGIYPIRVIHNIGNQQGDLEWFTVDPAGKVLTLISSPGGLKSYARGPALPAYVRRVSPAPNIAGLLGQTVEGVTPGAAIFAEIKDEGTTVSPGNASLRLDGGGQSTATKANGLTTVTLTGVGNLAPGSTHEVTLTYTDSAGKTVTDSWKFVMSEAFGLDPDLAYPVGSGDASKRGFAMRVVQLPIGFVSGENGSVTKSEALLAGVFLNGTNVANLDDGLYPHQDGWFQVSTINFGNGGGAPNNIILPDDPMPGLPGLTGHSDHYAAEIRTYLEFPAEGLYNMTIYSDDSPRLFQAEAQNQHFGAVELVSPCEVAGQRIAMCATRPSIGSGFGADLPTTPLVLKLIAADPLLGNAALVNAEAAKDSAVLLKRGDVAFGIKAANAKAAGAKAVIIFNNESPEDRMDRPPIFMGGTAEGVDIPCVFIGYRDGTNLLSRIQAGPVEVNLQENPAPTALVPNDGYTGSWDFTVFAPKAGVYPFRLVTGNGGGDYGIEWTVVKADNTRVLLNTADDPEALKAFRSVTTRPTLLTPTTGDNCDEVDITWRGSGRLLEATTVNGPYTLSADQSLPHVEHGGAQKFFKVEQMK